MTKLTGNWYTDPMGEFYSWQDYEQLYREQEKSNTYEKNNKITEKDCKKCQHLEILNVQDDYIYRCSMATAFRTNNIKNIVTFINNNNIKCR